jgi:hypothetical protein
VFLSHPDVPKLPLGPDEMERRVERDLAIARCADVVPAPVHLPLGSRDKLSERDLTFVGVDTWPIVTPGWRSPTGLYLDDPLEGFGAVGRRLGRAARDHVGWQPGADRVPDLSGSKSGSKLSR